MEGGWQFLLDEDEINDHFTWYRKMIKKIKISVSKEIENDLPEWNLRRSKYYGK